MLSRIQITDLAVVASLEAEFGPGMSVLTGETGAGKSILIDALGLVLGDRADKSMVRTGADRADIAAVFSLGSLPQATAWLAEQSLDDGDECILRRVVMRANNSRAFINGTPVPVRSLQALGELLVDIHGQHAHQSLLRRNHQRELLDDFAGHLELCRETADLFHRWHGARQQLVALQQAAQERSDRLELLSFQVDELDALGLADGEMEQLDRQQLRLSNALQLQQQCEQILQLLYDSELSVQAQLSSAGATLDQVTGIEPALSDCREMLDSALIQVQESVAAIRHYADDIEINPQKLQQIDQRLAQLHDLARKYRCSPQQLGQHQRDLRHELEQLRAVDDQLAGLAAEAEKLETDYQRKAAEQSKRRRQAARRLGAETGSGMRQLGMPDGRMAVQITPLPTPSASGIDQVEFLISANPGMPLQPLARIASGGELSRISLAIQVATLACAKVPTLIFDEVDVGIGGGVAEIVGRLLRKLGEQRQVLCVTHLPQVAAQGHQHLLISKRTCQGAASTSIQLLDTDQRIREVARMLGGVDITDSTLNHAREMVELSQS